MIMLSYSVISTINQKKKHVKFPKHLPFEKYCQTKTCFKIPDRPTCIDLTVTNPSRSFQDTCTVETGLSDFHKLVVTVVKLYFPKQKSDIQSYQNLMDIT